MRMLMDLGISVLSVTFPVKLWCKIRNHEEAPQWAKLMLAPLWTDPAHALFRQRLRTRLSKSELKEEEKGVAVPIISLKVNNVVEKELGYGTQEALTAWHPCDVVFMEISVDEGVGAETLASLTDEDNVAFCLFGDYNEIWKTWGMVTKRGRHDLRIINVNQNWKKDDPEFGPIASGFKVAQKAALLGGTLHPSYPWTNNVDFCRDGWPEYVYLLGLFKVSRPDDKMRVMLRLLQQRTPKDSLIVGAWLSASVTNAEFSVELQDAPKTGCEHEVGLAYEEARSQLTWTERAVGMLRDGLQVTMRAVRRPDEEAAKMEQQLLKKQMKKDLKEKEKVVKNSEEDQDEDQEEAQEEEEEEPLPPSIPRREYMTAAALAAQPPYEDPTEEELAKRDARNKRIAKTLATWTPGPETMMRQSKPVARLNYGEESGKGSASSSGDTKKPEPKKKARRYPDHSLK